MFIPLCCCEDKRELIHIRCLEQGLAHSPVLFCPPQAQARHGLQGADADSVCAEWMKERANGAKLSDSPMPPPRRPQGWSLLWPHPPAPLETISATKCPSLVPISDTACRDLNFRAPGLGG